MRRILNIFLVPVIFINITLLPGCWNYREIEKYAIVAGYAFDWNPDNGKYIVTIETIDFGGAGKDVGIKSEVSESEGETLFDAVRNMLLHSNRRMYFAHTKIFIVSQNIAKEGLTKVLDYISRDAELRMDVYLLVSSERTAREILYQKESESEIVSYNIRDMLEHQKSLGRTPAVTVQDYVNSVSGKMGQGIAAIIGIGSSEGKKFPKLMGTAVFKHDRFNGFLDTDDSKYLSFLIKQFDKGLLVEYDDSGDNKDRITLEVMEAKTNIMPEVHNEKLNMKIEVRLRTAIGELETSTDYIEEEKLGQLKKKAEEDLKKKLTEFINKVQVEFGTDILGFEKYVKADEPYAWDLVEKNWDEIYRDMDVYVYTRIDIANSAKASEPIKVGG